MGRSVSARRRPTRGLVRRDTLGTDVDALSDERLRSAARTALDGYPASFAYNANGDAIVTGAAAVVVAGLSVQAHGERSRRRGRRLYREAARPPTAGRRLSGGRRSDGGTG